MKHLEPLKVTDPTLLQVMEDVKAIMILYRTAVRKVIPQLEKQLHEERAHAKRLEMVRDGKQAELIEGLRILYDVDEPDEKYCLQFDFDRKLVRKIRVPQARQEMHNPWGEPIVSGDEWKFLHEPDIDESIIDWENPQEVKIYKAEKEKQWKAIRNMRDDGIDWQRYRDEKDEEKKDKKDDEDDTPEPPQANAARK